MQIFTVREVTKELGVSSQAFRYHYKDLLETEYFVKDFKACITESGLIKIAHSPSFKARTVLLKFLEKYGSGKLESEPCQVEEPAGLDDQNTQIELENHKKALDYLQNEYTALEKNYKFNIKMNENVLALLQNSIDREEPLHKKIEELENKIEQLQDKIDEQSSYSGIVELLINNDEKLDDIHSNIKDIVYKQNESHRHDYEIVKYKYEWAKLIIVVLFILCLAILSFTIS